ncbi:repressor [Xenorhabdus stockiae]|uniref:Repressor n=1 Tax=Xenorhabdus stockiae TaxID=351614 RepID=A0A2D0KLZ4_9GAMM|nr:phage repressor protein CI [Xenorhabdus stockiae]PHM64464.1 repressor [Xenorhabdus stockiae]
MFDETNFNNEELLNRICQIYGFSQKIQLAKHFNIAASSIQNRYKRGNMSYDLAVHCALETGASINWLMTGEGSAYEDKSSSTDTKPFELLSLIDGKLTKNANLNISGDLFNKQLSRGVCIRTDGKTHFIEQDATLSDGLWLVDIEGAMSIRELTILPGKKLHVSGGNVPFECSIDDIKTLGRVVGIYSEVNQ